MLNVSIVQSNILKGEGRGVKLKAACIVFVVLLTLVPGALLNQEMLVKADEGVENPSTEVIDYHNGTIRTIVDYGNGTQDHTVETTTRKTVVFHDNNGSNLSLFLPRSNESQLQTAKVSKTEIMQEEVIIGFTKELLKERYQLIDLWVVVAYFHLWIDFDFEFGLRLPINISVEYPSAVNFDGSIEEINVTITPIDKPSFDEFLCIYQISAIVEAGILVWTPFPVWDRYGPYELSLWGEDRSKSFRTPMGDNIVFPIDPWEVLNIFDVSFVSIGFGVAPGFGSKKVTAEASAVGDASISGSKDIEWSEPNQTSCFEVQFGGVDPTSEGATITISDYRYYFTELALGIFLMIDFTSWIDWAIKDFNILLFTIPMNWVHDYLGYYYISSEQTLDLWFGPPDVRRDIAVTSVFCNVNEVHRGGLVNITVVVENVGVSTEIFNVTAFYDEEPIATISNEILENGTSRTFHFTWDTGAVAVGSYVISAEVTQVPDEFDIDNNVKVDGTVTVRVLYELRVNVVDGVYHPISGAKVEVDGSTKFTAANGSITFLLSEGTYDINASKDLLSNTAAVNLNRDTTITLMLSCAPVGGKTIPITEFTAKSKLKILWLWLSTIILLTATTIGSLRKKKRH